MHKTSGPDRQSGNVLLYILIAIFLIGSLTVALRDNGSLKSNVDSESLDVKANQVLAYTTEISQAVQTLLDKGVSETALRFAHPDASAGYGTITTTPQNQVFSVSGGKAVYRTAPSGISQVSNRFAFTGNRAMAKMGSAKAELGMALIVTKDFCTAVNKKLGYTSIPNASTCGDASTVFEFVGGYTLNKTVTPAGQTQPTPQICTYCTDRSEYLFFSTLISR